VGIFFGHLVGTWLTTDNRAIQGANPLLELWAFFAFIYLGVVVHEAGHFAAGRLAGLKLFLLRIGPLQINVPFRLSWHWREKTGLNGLISMLPREGEVPLRKILIMVIGGPAANLLSAAAVLCFENFSDNASVYASIFVLSALLLGLGNLLPFQARGMISDGKRIWILLSKKERAERWLALFQLTGAFVRGTNIEDLPQSLLKKAIAFKDDSPDTVAAHVLAYGAAFNKNETGEAARLLEICLAYSKFGSPMMREALISEAAGFQGRRNKDAALAQQWLADLPRVTRLPGQRLWAEAAVLQAQGDVDGALSKLGEYEQAIQTMNHIQRRMCLRSLQKWKLELQSQLVGAELNRSGSRQAP
jgi:hypothetical protein